MPLWRQIEGTEGIGNVLSSDRISVDYGNVLPDRLHHRTTMGKRKPLQRNDLWRMGGTGFEPVTSTV